MVFCPLVGWTSQKLNRKLVIFISLVLCAIANIIIGKDEYLGLTNNLYI